MIAIVGKISAGKTTLLNWLADKGHKTLEVDKFVINLYKDASFVEYVKNNLDYDLITNNYVDKEKIKKWIIEDSSNLNLIGFIVEKFLFHHLKNSDYHFVEFPTIFKASEKTLNLFTKIWNVEIDENLRKNYMWKKYGDNSIIKILDSENNYNWGLKDQLHNLKIVNISSLNIDILYENEKYNCNCSIKI
ncbi:hypothetical protein MCANPG14_02456 [Mycoplasmopsis canis PG 14]|uniref:Dephospho-CoA kinase n=1 Tax=Mycoplasmopsis canis TaxID=29555 RepID=A0A449AR91_9BACT|nr:hypothetical protein [Mycoplasmopsis canis]AMD81050.1 hypothetical protein AXW82_00510 [Mycoplasmopsis canis PG 14]EIE39891.1 hypothetical protein MCANPG14_02456 [Mycoplasmopsis canis PG 14]VEU68862.1 dephospho-CoA kinase [Mycoplasmopsis canis]